MGVDTEEDVIVDDLFRVEPRKGAAEIEVIHRDQVIADICSHINMIHTFGDRALILHAPSGSGRTMVLRVIEKIQTELSGEDNVYYLDNFSSLSTAKEREEKVVTIRKRLNELAISSKKSGKLVVIVDDFDLLLTYPQTMGGPMGSHLDPIVSALSEVVVILMVSEKDLNLVRRHQFANRFEYYQIPTFNETQTMDIIRESLKRNELEGTSALEFAERLVQRPYFLNEPSLKKILRICYSSYVRLINNKNDLISDRVRKDWTKNDSSDSSNYYSAMSLFSKFNSEEITNGMTFAFSREEIEKGIDNSIIISNKNKTYLVNTLARKYLGINEPGKPMSVVLCIGPTGVGKTETAKVVAELGFGDRDRMVTIDMGEYSLPHHVNKLIGSAPGYVGYGEGSDLTRELDKKNPCITGDTLIRTTNEDLPANEIYRRKDTEDFSLHSIDPETGKKQVIRMYNMIRKSGKPCIKITTENGSIECTEDHKLLCYRNNKMIWVKAANITMNDDIIEL